MTYSLFSKQLFTSIILIVSLFIVSCNHHASGATNAQDSLLTSIKESDKGFLDKGKAVYLILPNEGCEGCISDAENFVKSFYDMNPQLKFIFTKIRSPKLLRIKLGANIYRDKHVVIDSTNRIKYPDLNKGIYPMIVYLKAGDIQRVAYESPNDAGVSDIKHYFE